MIARSTWSGRIRSAVVLSAGAALAVAASAEWAGAQLRYDRTTFLHGLGSDSSIWRVPHVVLGNQSSPGYLGRRVVLKAVGTPYLNAGAQGRPDSTLGLSYTGQRDNLVRFVGGAPGQHVFVGHSLGSLVARGAFAVSNVGAQRVSGIVTIAAPHQGALLADSARLALRYFEDLDAALLSVKDRLNKLGGFWQSFGAILLSPVALVIGHQQLQNARGIQGVPVSAVAGLTSQIAIQDLRPAASAIQELNAYRGDAGVPRANIRGSIPYDDAVLRLAASTTTATTFESLRQAKRKGLTGLRKCRNYGAFTFNLAAPGNRCRRAMVLLRSLDARWAGWVNGTEPVPGWVRAPDNTLVQAQGPRKVAFDGVVPNERSNYPTSDGLTYEATVPNASHQDIYRSKDGLDRTAEGMLRMGMQPATLLTAAVSGPSEFTSSQTLTWRAAPGGGDGVYAYQWSYRPSGSQVWSTFGGTGASASRVVGASTPSFAVRVAISSQGQITTAEKYVMNGNAGGGGCVPNPPAVVCAQ